MQARLEVRQLQRERMWPDFRVASQRPKACTALPVLRGTAVIWQRCTIEVGAEHALAHNKGARARVSKPRSWATNAQGWLLRHARSLAVKMQSRCNTTSLRERHIRNSPLVVICGRKHQCRRLQAELGERGTGWTGRATPRPLALAASTRSLILAPAAAVRLAKTGKSRGPCRAVRPAATPPAGELRVPFLPCALLRRTRHIRQLHGSDS